MQEFMRSMTEWLLVRIIGAVVVSCALAIMYASFNFSNSINVF